MSDASKRPDPAGLEQLRAAVLDCDRLLIDTLSRRRNLVREIGALKASLGLPVTDPRREAAVVRRAAELARNSSLDEELVRDLIWKIMASARQQQHMPSEEPEADRKNPAGG